MNTRNLELGIVLMCVVIQALGSPKVMVNLVNLIDHRRRGTPLLRFKSIDAFRAYTAQNIFPKKAAKKDGFLRALLRHVF